ncbi:MAG: Ditrans,polycis-undecaprenyl-diphosphate synthase ((2E,6E)-farnesyl-diphosphate specific) [Tenericutes bacterium ADurb.Bin087]|nr:MAG: Ditrans,polycis-undecaprenyl-diphosphate synthase ((2E,6E)-farnesyl-diphosphate specific) [Tenericutes bacterium ADurb.Bin087]
MSKVKITNLENYGIKHIAFILDGNGRWAKARNKPRTYGHEKGFSSLFDVGIAVNKRQIPFMSVYAFSTENWSRPKKEVDFLFKTLERRLHSVLKKVHKNNIKIVTSGDLSRLPTSTQEAINYAKDDTKHNTGTTLNICINYGGKDEIVRAVKKLVADKSINVEQLTPETFENYLDTKDMPPVDLLVRTSGEMRLSNYMLWQLAYAEFIFTPTYWPDYSEECLVRDLEEYAKRTRRFGGL